MYCIIPFRSSIFILIIFDLFFFSFLFFSFLFFPFSPGAVRASAWDVFGFWRIRRVKYGADDALQDGADLGHGLRTGRYHLGNLGKYTCTKQKEMPTK